MSKQPPLYTSTAEIYQPVRLLYEVADPKRLVAVFNTLKCMDHDKPGNRWVWIYDDEVRSLKFNRSWKEVSQVAPIVIGSLFQPAGRPAEFVVTSIERAVMALSFMDKHVPRSVARVTCLDIVNRLIRHDEADVKTESFFANESESLELQGKVNAEIQTNPMKQLSLAMKQLREGESQTLPDVERIACHFYEDGVSSVEAILRMRQGLAMRHWNGESHLTMMDLITEGVSKMMGTSSQATAKPTPKGTRIDWDLDPDIPSRDFLDCIDLTTEYGVSEALDYFLDDWKNDEVRLWEAVIREEQDLRTIPILSNRLHELFSFGEPEPDEGIHYINGMTRLDAPWYEILQKIAAHLVVDRIGNADNQLMDWHSLLFELQRRSRGLSLPAGVDRAIDVVPTDLRHQLNLLHCFDVMSYLDHKNGESLANEDELWRIDLLQKRLWQQRESVAWTDLTFGGMLERCKLSQPDQRILSDSFRQRLGLQSADEALAPRLRDVQRASTTAPPTSLDEQVIRNGILHPERVVHRTAMWYFAGSKSRDPQIAPLVLDALDELKDSEDRNFAAVCLKRLLISDDAAERILNQLQSHCPAENDSEDADTYVDGLFNALLSARPGFLADRKERIDDIVSRLKLEHLVRLNRLEGEQDFDSDECWDQFTTWVEASLHFGPRIHCYPSHSMVDNLEQWAYRLGDDPRPAAWVKQTLPRTLNDENYSLAHEIVAVRLAGALQLPWVVPFLIALLHDDDPRMVREAVQSLVAINDDSIPASLDRWFHRGDPHYQFAAIDILQRLHTPEAIQVLQQWLISDDEYEDDEYEDDSCNDESIDCRIRQALLAQFLTSELEPVRAWYLENLPCCDESADLQRMIVANALLVDQDFPERDDWLTGFREEPSSHDSMWDAAMDVQDSVGTEDDGYDDDDDDDDEDDEYEGSFGYEDDEEEGSPYGHGISSPLSSVYEGDSSLASQTRPIGNAARRTGRNDPCPCGSNKKYKKCCLKNE